jgi:hypothetical protein
MLFCGMKKIKFTEHVLPHLIAVVVFLIVTFLFFKPLFFENKTLTQYDIQQFEGSVKSIKDFREAKGEEPLWTNSMFGGMPAYLISVDWGSKPISSMKLIMTLGISHPISSIFAAFISYYILLLAFRVRPYLAMSGAIAFGLSSYVIIGLAAGHNGRIGAIAFMPLVVAGIHLAFTKLRLLGFAVTAAGLALHLRENHMQITYYLILIVCVYGLVQLIYAFREKTIPDFFKTLGVLVVAALLAAGTFFGQLWSTLEYTAYSTRGKSELSAATKATSDGDGAGLDKEYAFEFSNGVLEPLTLLIPNIYGGSSSNYLVQDKKSKTYNALVKSGDQAANQLAYYSSSYWGPQRLSAPYYAGAIIVFLFAAGIAFAEKRYVWWLVSIAALGIMLSWGSTFSSFNYFMFDYFPAYNKFRSVTFTLVIVLFAMPLLGMIGLERMCQTGLDKVGKKKLLIAFGSTAGICLLFFIAPGLLAHTKETENELPEWFVNALVDDREGLLRSDAFRSLAFIFSIFILLYLNVHKKISPAGFYAFLFIVVAIDLSVVDKRYFTQDNYKRKHDKTFFAMTDADKEILKDKSNYRVFAINPQNPFGAFSDARPSYHYQSIGGYHGAKLRRYQDFIDSCFFRQTQQFFTLAQQGNFDFSELGGFNMLNIKYLPYGPGKANIITNNYANGNAWFVRQVEVVNTPTEELAKVCEVDTKATAVVDGSKFKAPSIVADTSAVISLKEAALNNLKYESSSKTEGLAVFSEIYYPKGWKAFIDGNPAEIIRADYILRALVIPEGTHQVEFRFEPDAYFIGNKITTIASWLVLLALIAAIVIVLREKKVAVA